MAFATIGTAGIQAQSIDLSTKVTGTLPVPNGGLGIASGTTGQFLKFTGTETLAPAEAGGGKLLQTQSALFTSQSAHNSETFTASNYTDQITPSATTSKILVQFNFRSHVYQASNTEVQSLLAVFRQINGGGYSQINPNSATSSWGMSVATGERAFYCTPQINFLDTTHNTTNAIDYKIYARRRLSTSGSVNVGGSSHQAQVILMEISA